MCILTFSIVAAYKAYYTAFQEQTAFLFMWTTGRRKQSALYAATMEKVKNTYVRRFACYTIVKELHGKNICFL